MQTDLLTLDICSLRADEDPCEVVEDDRDEERDEDDIDDDDEQRGSI